jgi:flagellar hook-associated protein 3 FlgL
MGRVSTVQFFDTVQRNIQGAKEKESVSAEKASSLKELSNSSQAPAEWLIAASQKNDLAIRDGISKNAGVASHMITTTDGVLAHAQDLVQRIHTLALSAIGTATGDVTKHVLPEVKGLYENFIQNLNTKFGPRSLLGGQKSGGPAFDLEGKFLGDAGKIQIEIDRGVFVPINVSGSQAILGEGLKDGVNIIQAMRDLIQGLESHNPDLVGGSLETFSKATDQLSIARTQLAGSSLAIESAINRNAETKIDQLDAISQIEEANPIKVFSDLARDQTVLKAALDSSHKIMSESPADILLKS